MSIVITNGETLTLTSGQTVSNGNQDVNGDTLIVQGSGTLNLGHDANGANITIKNPQVTINIAHDLNGNATVTDIGGVFIVGHDANGAKFNVSNGGTIELSHAYSGSTFALSGQNNTIIFGANNFPVSGGSLSNQITGLNAGDKIELNGQTFTSATFSGNTITLSNGFKLTNAIFAAGSPTKLITGVDPITGFNYIQVAPAGRTISTALAGPVTLGAADNPLTIRSTGSITSIAAGNDGLDGAAGTAWTVTNAGSVSAATGDGISLLGAGSIVSNTGSVSGRDGVVLRAGGTVTNNVNGSIAGNGASGLGPGSGAGINVGGGSGTVNNNAKIGGAAYGVALGQGGMVTNTGMIVGGEDGVSVQGASGTLINSGSITATLDDGIALFAGGNVANNAGASIIGQIAGAFLSGSPTTVTNNGVIAGVSSLGILMTAGGTITNGATGSISSKNTGVFASNVAASVNNAGLIAAAGGITSVGIELDSGGSVTNASTGVISGTTNGIFATGSLATITNSGQISGAQGVTLFAGGAINNNAGASLSGLTAGVFGGTAPVILTNAGTITASAAGTAGADIEGGGAITNKSGGAISGSSFGVFVSGGAGTVVNSGTISGSTYAVDFANSVNDLLVVGPGAVFNGGVQGGSAVNTLELAAGTGSIGGINTGKFFGFQAVNVDAGGIWTATGANTASTVTNNGSLDVSGSFVSSEIKGSAAGLFTIDTASSLEVVNSAQSSLDQMRFLNSGTLVIDNASMFGANVGLASYVGPLLENFGATDTIDIKNFSATGVSLTYDSAHGLLQLSNGAQNASLSFQTSSLGSGSFNVISDGSAGLLLTHGAAVV